MPWCSTCDKWRAPNALLIDGSCPKCGGIVEAGALAADAAAGEGQAGDAPAQAAVKIPWHFWVMVAATVAYLGWRVVQGVGALF